MHTKLISLLAALLLCGTFTACSGTDTSDDTALVSVEIRDAVTSEELQFTAPTQGDTIVTFTTDLGSFSAVLYPELAPQACENFTTLAKDGFYDGTAINRIISGFCVQAGLDANGQASTIWNDNTYPMETSDALHHYAGALCVAPDTSGEGSSPFYVVQASPSDVSDAMVSAMQDATYRDEVIAAYQAAGGVPYLDYTNTVFGQIYEGMDVIDTIAALETDENDAPLEEILMTSVTVSTYQ